MHAQRALRTRHMTITVQLMRPGPRSMALRLALVSACPRRPGLPGLPIEHGPAAQVVGLELGAVRGGLRLAPSLAHMRQTPYAAMLTLRRALDMKQTVGSRRPAGICCYTDIIAT